MMARPWAKATATIPLRPVPPPTTAAVPAPMNTNEKVPMNSARSLGAIRLDIVDSTDEIDWSARSGQRQGTIRWLGVADGAGERRRPTKRAGLLRSDHLRFELDAQRLRDARAVGGIGLGAVADMPLLNVLRSAADLASRIVEQRLLLGGAHLAEEVARLLVVIVVDTMVQMRGPAFDLQRRLVKLRLVGSLAPAIGEVGGSSAEVAVSAHGAVAVIAVERAFRGVDRDVVVIDPQAVALRISIGEEAGLQHLVRRIADARHDVGRRKRRLFDFGEDVFGVPVELEISDLDQREVALWPDLGQVEGVEGESLRLSVRHHLDEQGPAWEIAGLDAFEQIALMGFAILADAGLGFRVSQVLDALLGAEVELDPDALVCGIEEAVRVAAETVHVTEALRNAAFAHEDGALSQALARKSPEVPVVVSAAHTGSRITLDGVV